MNFNLKTRSSKILLLVFIICSNTSVAMACAVCAENQPAGLENITHGEGPTAIWDYIITWSAVIIVILTLIYSLKFIIKPQEKSKSHIKNIVLDNF